MIQTKISAIGNSSGIILPKEVLAELGLLRGDTVGLAVHNGALHVVKADDAYNRALEAGRECFDRYPAALAELAK